MNRNDLLKRICRNGTGLVERYLPTNAPAELEGVIRDRRHDIDKDAFFMFMSVRALLREGGMASCESDREAGQIMALLHT